MLGNVDSGKSTTSAVLTSAPGSTDDGRGTMREKVFNYAHEKSNGRTSSVAHEIMGFKADGTQYTTTLSHTTKKNKIWPDIVANSAKIIHLLDMCGHQKYFKTTVHGLTSLFPDYCFLVIGANMGISKMTKEHLACSLALDIPVFVVFTKIDLAPVDIFKANMDKIATIMKKHCDKVPVKVKNEEDVFQVVQTIETGKICPIFTISNTTGENIELLRLFLSRLPKVRAAPAMEMDGCPIEYEVTNKFIVDSRYFSKGVGLILGGTVLKGSVSLNQEMMFGPDRQGNFKPVVIKGIHENRVEVTEAGEMASVCVAVKVTGKNTEPIKNNHIRKGSCLINPLNMKAKGVNPY
jgi:GTPase